MKPREYLTPQQIEYILANNGEKYISEMARALKIPASRIFNYLKTKNINFKRVARMQKSDRIFKEGCFNPHERENWLI